jgi:hypothetical protein
MDANSEIRIGVAILNAVGLHPRFALSACGVRASRAALLGCKGLGWHFWGGIM